MPKLVSARCVLHTSCVEASAFDRLSCAVEVLFKVWPYPTRALFLHPREKHANRSAMLCNGRNRSCTG
eukprot:3471320-Amphidinium_carterae.1